MAAETYKNVLEVAGSLSACDRARLIEEFRQGPTRPGSREPSGEKKHSILELRGLGKEFWQTIDTDVYLRNERSSWDG